MEKTFPAAWYRTRGWFAPKPALAASVPNPIRCAALALVLPISFFNSPQLCKGSCLAAPGAPDLVVRLLFVSIPESIKTRGCRLIAALNFPRSFRQALEYFLGCAIFVHHVQYYNGHTPQSPQSSTTAIFYYTKFDFGHFSFSWKCFDSYCGSRRQSNIGKRCLSVCSCEFCWHR